MQQGREVTVSLAILNLAELNLHPRPCPWCSLFLCWKETLIPQPIIPVSCLRPLVVEEPLGLMLYMPGHLYCYLSDGVTALKETRSTYPNQMPSVIHNRTADGRDVAFFRPAVQCQCPKTAEQLIGLGFSVYSQTRAWVQSTVYCS